MDNPNSIGRKSLDEDEIQILGNDYLKLNPKDSEELAQIEEREQALIEMLISKS